MATIIKAQQGSKSWHQHRASHFNASEAPAMMGCSSYKTRGQLLDEKKSGITPDVDEATQARFDKGHEYEAIARPWAEEIIGEELYPVVLAEDIDGLPLSASLDGLTMDDSVAFEHKSGNEKLRTAIDNGEQLPLEYRVQMEQQMLVSGAEKCLFMASSGDKDQMRYCWYESDKELQQKIVHGWRQFNIDLAAHDVVEPEKPAVGATPENLPALNIQVSGNVVASNLDQFKEHALAVFKGINTDLQTDQDFADAEATVKFCKDIEKRLDGAKDAALGQTADIYAVLQSIDEIKESARQKRLELDKLVKAEKESRKRDILRSAQDDFTRHEMKIQRDLEDQSGWSVLPGLTHPDIAGAMKGKRTIKSLQDAANTAVANAKIEADQVARDIRESITVLQKTASGYESLFPDAGQLVVSKSAEDLLNLARTRIAEHEKAEQARLEAERERIRQEEERKAAAKRAEQERATEVERKQQPEAPDLNETGKAEPTPPAAPAKADGYVDEAKAIENMQRYGGGFVSRLGAAWAHADQNNRQRLAQAFPDLLQKYSDMAA